MTTTFDLEDGEARNKSHPETFYLPPLEERQSLRVGDNAKVIFKTGKAEGPVSERMWVEVTAVADDGAFYHGEINNDPVVIAADYRDPVTFEPRHVIDIIRKL